MPITVEWQSDQKTIIIFTYTKPWTWNEFHQTIAISNTMKDSVAPHTVDHIYDMRKGGLMPLGGIGQISSLRHRVHPNFGKDVLVTSNRFFVYLNKTIQKIYPGIAKNFSISQNLEAALETLNAVDAVSAVSK